MPYNIDEMKKLSKAEKLEIIHELLLSIDSEMAEESSLTAYDSNTMKFYSWEEVKERLVNRLKGF